jgi:hypothetical protein
VQRRRAKHPLFGSSSCDKDLRTQRLALQLLCPEERKASGADLFSRYEIAEAQIVGVRFAGDAISG